MQIIFSVIVSKVNFRNTDESEVDALSNVLIAIGTLTGKRRKFLKHATIMMVDDDKLNIEILASGFSDRHDILRCSESIQTLALEKRLRHFLNTIHIACYITGAAIGNLA
jgi:hypothetical protein